MADDHRIVLTFEPGYGAAVKIIHPESGCQPPSTCGACGRDLTDPESKPCYDCEGAKPEGCWLDGWDSEASEYLEGRIELPVHVTWQDDGPLFEFSYSAPLHGTEG